MKVRSKQFLLLGYVLALAAAQFADHAVDDDAQYDDFIRIEPGLSDREKAELSRLVVGGARAAQAHNLLQSGLLTATLADDEENLCPNHTELMLQAVAGGEMWALQMIDAIGRQPSALLYDGNFRWLGSWEECLAVEPVGYDDPVNKTGLYTPFKPKYCQAKFTFKQPLLITKQATVGMCFPDTCTDAKELKALSDTLASFLQLPQGTLKARSVVCTETDRDLSSKAIAVIVVCSLFIAVMVIATLYDFYILLFLNKKRTKKPKLQGIANSLYESTAIDGVDKNKITSNALSSYSFMAGEKPPLAPGSDTFQPVPENSALSSYSFMAAGNKSQSGRETSGLPSYNSVVGGEKSPLLLDLSQSATQTNALSHHASDVKKVAQAPPKQEKEEEEIIKYNPGKLGQLLLSFSMYTNGCKILDTNQSAGTLTAVNGIRFLSMSWVILSHTLSFKGQAPENYNKWIAKVIKTWSFEAISNATVSVDSFFVLSGLLVGYLSLKEMKRKGGPKKVNWFLYYFHRFWRLTPPYMLVMMVYVPLLGYWGDGPIWNPDGIEKDECEKTWWHNLLYINNLVDHKENRMCMGWSWYLANDMQFYVISPLMLIPLFYSKIAGSIVCFALLMVNFISAGVISAHYNFYAVQKIDSPKTPGVSRSDEYYYRPYTRIGPYVIGIFVGYLLYRTNCKVKIGKFWNAVGWTVAAVLGYLVVYGPYTSDGSYSMNDAESAFYNAAHRIGWGIAVAWVIFACATGYGGPVNKILSWRGIIPLSRLTYCAYLVHPVVMKTYYNSVRSLQHWYDLEFDDVRVLVLGVPQRLQGDPKSEVRSLHGGLLPKYHSTMIKTPVYQFLANLTWSMATAFVVSLAFEAPMMGLEKVLLAKYKK